MITVHIVFNAHLDPVWLWPWPSGLDALLGTCRSACDRLDNHEDLHFCKGEAWGYERIEQIAPPLFERIRAHVQAGRWHIVGGWWIQPDCNGPTGVGFERQIQAGKEYFLDRFGQFPRTAWNVDTFGHTATLPTIMHAAGQDRYVMMRPQEHEMALPARVFRWREREGGPEIVTFRIARAYTCREITMGHVQAALTELPPGIDHTMCFAGLGDHGGGPTERQIAWCRDHAEKIPGCRLVFSSPDRFFDAIWDRRDTLPIVTGELQQHAVGCYTVHRPVKVAVRQAEHALFCAERAHAADPRPEPDTAARLADAWKRVCFAHFHDTYGGTCIPSAYGQIHAQIGESLTVADDILQHALRRRMEAFPDDPQPRIVLCNASDTAYDGYAVHEAWSTHAPYPEQHRLIDERGETVPHQLLHGESLVLHEQIWLLPLLLRIHVEPGELRVLRIVRADASASDGSPAAVRVLGAADELANDASVALRLKDSGELQLSADMMLPLPQLDLVDDPSDTWSHDVDRYGAESIASAEWEKPEALDQGPLMGALEVRGQIGQSTLVAEYRVYAGEPFAELLLRVAWAEQHKALKLTVSPPGPLTGHVVGIPGGELRRLPDERELPAHDRTLVELADGRRLGLVFPDAYALDARADRLRITLLRSPLMAHHDPYRARGPRGIHADQGVHEFRFRFLAGPDITGRDLDRQALMFHRPLLGADLTRGMPPE